MLFKAAPTPFPFLLDSMGSVAAQMGTIDVSAPADGSEQVNQCGNGCLLRLRYSYLAQG